MHGTATVDGQRAQVPATTANLGAGFDVLALALDIANMIHVEAVEHPAARRVDLRRRRARARAGCAPTGATASGALERGLRDVDVHPRGRRLARPHAQRHPAVAGLGSSASATVAGLLAADALAGGGACARRDPVARRAGRGPRGQRRGRPAGRLRGGREPRGRRAARGAHRAAGGAACGAVHPRAAAVHARRCAPRCRASVPFADAVHNVGASSLAVAAFASGRLDLLLAATDDRLHEPYRARAYPELPLLIAAARAAGALGACLSGAGSPVIAFADDRIADGDAAALRRAAAPGLAGRRAGRRGAARGRRRG